MAEEDIYICPAGEKLAHHFTNEENGLVLRRYWTNACRTCAVKAQCTKGPQRRITRWEHEHVVDAVQARPDKKKSGCNAYSSRDGRASVWHAEDADGGDALSDEDAAQGGDRDGVARARLQPHARVEPPRYQTAPRRDPGVRSVYCCARRVTVQVAQRGPRLRPDLLRTRYSKNMLRRSHRRGSRPVACSFWGRKNVSTRPGTLAELNEPANVPERAVGAFGPQRRTISRVIG